MIDERATIVRDQLNWKLRALKPRRGGSTYHFQYLFLHITKNNYSYIKSYMFSKHFDFHRYVSYYAPLYNVGQTKEEFVPTVQKKILYLKNHKNKFVVQTFRVQTLNQCRDMLLNLKLLLKKDLFLVRKMKVNYLHYRKSFIH